MSTGIVFSREEDLIFDGTVQISPHDAQLNPLHVSFKFLAQAKSGAKLTNAFDIKEMSNYLYFFCLFRF
jgi:hypothetical protein